MTEECGRLARWLRLLGYDTTWQPAQPVSALYRRAYNESRIVVTRDGRIGASCLFRVIQLTSTDRDAQLQQILQTLRLDVDHARPFSRCDVCNVPVQPIERASVKTRVPPYVYTTQQTFHACPSCQRIYWAATHWQRARAVFERLKQ